MAIKEEMPTIPAEKEAVKPDKMFAYALKIKSGEAGGEYLYCLEDDKFYHYKDGYWEALFNVDFLGRVQEHLQEIIKYSIGVRKQIVDNFKCIARKKLELFNSTTLINLINGMLCPKTIELREHHPRYYSTNRLPYKYDKEAKCELWLKSLNEIFENDLNKINILQEYFGYCLTRDTKQHKALLLLGESRSGKSTILHILRHMVGENNCSAVPLRDIRNPQHTPDLINKLVNFDYDVDNKATEFEGEFKKITTGEPIRANQKYVCAFSFSPYCKLAMAANIFPRITDHSSAFYNRLILIPCDRVFSPEEQNRDLPDQLIDELPGILNWSIEGLRRLTVRGKFEDLEFLREAVEELENENNPVNLFFEENIEVMMGEYIEKGFLFDRYKEWCEKTRNFALSKARFASCLYKRYHKQTPKNGRLDNSGKRVWRNLKYVYEKQENEERVDWQE